MTQMENDADKVTTTLRKNYFLKKKRGGHARAEDTKCTFGIQGAVGLCARGAVQMDRICQHPAGDVTGSAW